MTSALTRPDLATLVARFGFELRNAGLTVSPDESAGFARAIEVAQPVTVNELYWCARVTLLRSMDPLAAFDRVFALVFRGLVDPAEFRGDAVAHLPDVSPEDRAASSEANLGKAGSMSASDAGNSSDGGEVDFIEHRAAASSVEQLCQAHFASLTPDELAALAPLLQRLLPSMPVRESRRRYRNPHGDRMDVRATLRRSIRSGGDPVHQIRRNRENQPRRLVALLDISGSMEPYARAYLHLLWGAAVHADAEVFVFGTRLTRLTRAMRAGRADSALERAARIMPDWSGGTRIGHAVKAFLDAYGRRGMAHGAVVLIVSDGWERDDPELLAAQVQALARRAHRLVWVNPRVAAPGFQPSTGGMSAVLPYLDALVSGHSTEAMHEVVRALDSAPRAGRISRAG